MVVGVITSPGLAGHMNAFLIFLQLHIWHWARSGNARLRGHPPVSMWHSHPRSCSLPASAGALSTLCELLPRCQASNLTFLHGPCLPLLQPQHPFPNP